MPPTHRIGKPDDGPGRWGAGLVRVLLRDYRSPYDPYLRWLRTPLACLVLAALAATLCGLFLHPQGFVLAMGLTVILGLGIAWPWLGLRGISGTLRFEEARGREGEPITVLLAVRNRLPWGQRGLTVRGLSPDEPEAAGLALAGGWRTTEARWRFVPPCRGEYPRGRPTIASGFPFGLWQARRALSVPTTVLVWPRTFHPGPIPAAAGDRSPDGPETRGTTGDAGDFAGVRPYRRGDTLRRIHWPQTARHGHLIVCERQTHARPWVQVVLDTDPRIHAGEGPDGSREWAIRIAASFLEGWLSQGARMEAVLGALVVSARAGADQRRRVLDALARLPEEGPPLREVLDLPACRRFAGGLRLVVTTDRGLAALPARLARDRAQRFVVLDAAGFAAREAQAEPVSEASPARPWIRIEDPSRVAERLRASWKEAADAS